VGKVQKGVPQGSIPGPLLTNIKNRIVVTCILPNSDSLNFSGLACIQLKINEMLFNTK
jgi:hypothetical protein